MKKERSIGWLLLIGAAGVLVPYTILTVIFEYPVILRQDTGTILTKFYNGGGRLIATWFAFAATGAILIPAYIFIGQKLERNSSLARFATTIGVIGLLVQLIGLLRWVFVVPVLSNAYVHAGDEATKAAAVIAFKTIHQFAGVLLGEHLGQLFTIVWTVIISIILFRIKFIPKWLSMFGIISSFIYLLAQAELFATVIPGFPAWDMAGFIGSTLWLVWLIILGIRFFKIQMT
ncbi:MAG: DUF4386 domain-containing protein [Ferruginibacter sp.]